MQARRAIVAFFGIALFLLCLPHSASAIARYMQPVAPGQGWTVNTQGLWWTDDDGIHWKNISPPEAKYFSDVFFIDASHGWALYANEGKKEGTLEFHVAITSDSGQAWSDALIQVPSQQPDELDGRAFLDFADSAHGWIVFHANSSSAFSWGLQAATEDGGKTWKELPRAPTYGRPTFLSALDGWILGPSWNGIYRTHDGGRSWQGAGPTLTDLPADFPTSPEYGPPEFTDARHGFLPVILTPASDAENSRPTRAIVYATNDGGNSWRRDRAFQLGVGRNVELFAMAGSTLMLVPMPDPRIPGRYSLISVGSGGEVGNPSSDILRADTPPEDQLQGLAFVNATSGWVSTKAGGLLSTEDGGAAWKSVGPRRPASPAKAQGATLKFKRISPSNRSGSRPPSAGLYTDQRLGFDTHNVLTGSAMQAWFDSSPFYSASFYAGGENYCGKTVNKVCVSRPDPGLGPGWVTQAQGQGWGFLPVWVGLQAPCNTGDVYLFSSVPTTAQSQGQAEADSASAAMSALGLSGTVVFYDMESYSAAAGSACSLAVRAFLTGWSNEMVLDGFQATAVYGNPGPAQRDFSKVPGLNQVWITWPPVKEDPPTPGGAPRVTIWGLGSGSNALTDSPWPNGQRAHQFLTDIPSISYGGTKGVQIDYDAVNLQIPGGSGHKGYDVPTPSTITYVGSLYDWAGGVNDVWLDSIGTPDFIIQGQTGQIVGTYSTSSGVSNGFIDNNGNITYLSNADWANGQTNQGLNNTGSFVGATVGDGFLGNIPSNTYTVVDGPQGAVAGVFLNSINDDGQAVGSYYVSNGTENVPLGFIYQNSTATNIDPGCPDESDDGSGGATFIYGINGYGQMVGHYASADGTQAHGFLYSNGTCTTIDIPGAYTGSTWPYGINNNGQIVGSYSNGTTILGFMLDGAVYYSFSYPPPQGDTTFETVPNGINDAAQIVGYAYGGGVVWYNAFEVGLVPAQ